MNILLSAVGYWLTCKLISLCGEMFVRANLFGVDLCKGTGVKIPESQGVLCGVVFLVIMFLFIPIPFIEYFTNRGTFTFPFHVYVEFLAALLSICCMVFLGFADDVFDLKWRHKLLLPTIASLPLLMVYLVTFDLTIIIIPAPFRSLLGYSINIGCLYYIYMGMLAVFCTNAINIVAGINGIEVGQSLVISASVIVFNCIEMSGEYSEAHLFSLYFMLPFFAVSLALYQYNKYPARVFVGDTFCYFSGMAFAVVAILGHFSKTMLLFFIPQVINFLYSVPQLFRFVPCPRHRLPKFNPKLNKLELSYSRFKPTELTKLGRIILKIASIFKLVHFRKVTVKDCEYEECNNLTIINFFLLIFGPTHEKTLTNRILLFQIVCSVIALFIRYPLARLFYDV
ncbi:hypothetical protein HELRODRAFT_94198 [Helobdella robusta]|uniref:UDP-N-acetylglucosamine--dolichyl-phosphate N-acetylglucosaminephosphotransferase n=1 Tax=Helobdella robusta TaxID=6412 RepID=T1G8Z3_HELRO|nr:hypothetical protein HELRODRAFT_94198 [Helobdella robusta]ESO06670.1 hypothetical protein HELRODRAFT_94198 [Helobdella robusta]